MNLNRLVLQNSESPELKEILTVVLSKLPSLPNAVSYFDDFDKITRHISDFESASSIKIFRNGSPSYIQFESSCYEYKIFLKQFFTFLLQNNLNIGSINQLCSSLSSLTQADICKILTTPPPNIKKWWLILLARDLPQPTYVGTKWLLKLKCHYFINSWSKESESLVSSLPLLGKDKYASLRNEDTFLAIDEEAKIIQYLDQISNQIQDGKLRHRSLSYECALLCSFHFGLRPVQIANIRLDDVKVYDVLDTIAPPIHLTIQMAKQKTKSKAIQFVRKLKQEWSYIFAEQHKYILSLGGVKSDRFLGVDSAKEMSLVISDIATKLVGRKITARNMRHSAAQRLVNSGASQDEVATFLSHTDIDTCLAYFNDSPSQAKALNDALMISETYSKVKTIADSRYISETELRALKGELQIGGMPNGIPITGIGACNIGQPNCKFNPISACYGCNNFMPLNDKTIHQRVLKDFRSIVTFFHKSDKNHKKNAAFSQLKRTLSEIKDVIRDLS